MRQPEWDAARYNRIATVQRDWGRGLLQAVDWRGDEVVLDAGCGTGTLAAEILARHARIRLVAVDTELSMVEEARRNLQGFGDRVRVMQGDLQELGVVVEADVVFSNAVLHWVPDLDAAMVCMRGNLKRVGLFVAQFGAKGNLARVRGTAKQVLAAPPYAKRIPKAQEPWHYRDEREVRRCLDAGGLEPVRLEMHEAPVRFPDDEAWEAFLRTVTLRAYLRQLGEDQQERFVADTMAALRSRGLERFLDYVRVTVVARAV